MNVIPQPAMSGLDWGTSSLRGYCFAVDGVVVDAVAKPWSIQHLPAGGFAGAFVEVVAGWRGRGHALPVVAAGMVGSRRGWREVPYVDCPADADAIARGVVAIDSEADRLHLVPGVIQRGPLPNVLRGEETQICNAFAHDAALAVESPIVLPGMHSKWVRVRDGQIIGFDTFLTGELFAVLREHSLLGKPAREPQAEAASLCHRSCSLATIRSVGDIARYSRPSARLRHACSPTVPQPACGGLQRCRGSCLLLAIRPGMHRMADHRGGDPHCSAFPLIAILRGVSPDAAVAIGQPIGAFVIACRGCDQAT